MRTHHRLGGGTLEEGAWLVVEAGAEKVVGRRVADLELDARIERHELHEIVRRERARLYRRRAGQRFGAERVDRADGSDAKLVAAGARLDVVPFECRRAELELGRSPRVVALEAYRCTARVGDEFRLAALREGRDAQRGVDEAQLSFVLGNDAPGVAVAIFAEQPE